MVFNSFPFVLFFPLVVLLYYLTPHRGRWLLLIAASSFFLMFAKPAYMLVIAAIIIINYLTGLGIEKQRDTPKARTIFILSLVADVGVLSFFKYFNWFNQNLASLASLAGWHNPIPELDILLPLGISYYTFQAIGYNYEIIQNEEAAEKKFGHFAAYILFFPKLIAGPIERAHAFLPQLEEKHEFDFQQVRSGLILMGWGFFKKVVIADRLAILVNPVYDEPGKFHGLPLILAVILYAFQLYFDFSGYTDIALGAARTMGFKLTDNFNLPFTSRSITEFWRRWHISLSSWVNDYIYKPLSMFFALNTNWGKWGLSFSLLFTFFILGLWHGPNWTYVAFGTVHGLALTYEFVTRKWRKKLKKQIPFSLFDKSTLLLTFLFYAFSCIFFRANSMSDAWYIFGHLFTGLGDMRFLTKFEADKFTFFISLLLLAFMWLKFQFEKKGSVQERLAKAPTWLRWTVYYAVILAILLFGVFDINEFLYVQF